MPIFGAYGIDRRGDRHRTPVDGDLTTDELGHAEAGQEQIELTHALQAGDAEDLAALERERAASQAIAGGEPRRAQHLGRISRPRSWARRKGLGDGAADDHSDDLRRR